LTAEPVEEVVAKSCKEGRLADFEVLVGRRDLWLASGLFMCLLFHNRIEVRAGQKVVLSEPANKRGESYGQNCC
jgi:hypothetical protein